MNSSHFRPGNFILSNSVEQINHSHLELLLRSKPGAQRDFKPIPISEDWLLAFGFKKVNNSWRSPDPAFALEIFGMDKLFVIEHAIATEVRWVHELQNHFLQVCGKELHINYEPWF